MHDTSGIAGVDKNSIAGVDKKRLHPLFVSCALLLFAREHDIIKQI